MAEPKCLHRTTGYLDVEKTGRILERIGARFRAGLLCPALKHIAHCGVLLLISSMETYTKNIGGINRAGL